LGGGITRGLEERDGRFLFPLLDATSVLLPFFFSLSMLILEGGAYDGLSGYLFGDGLGQRRFLCRLYVFPCVCFNFSIVSFPCTDGTSVSCCVVTSILCAHGIIFAIWRDRVTLFLDKRTEGHRSEQVFKVQLPTPEGRQQSSLLYTKALDFVDAEIDAVIFSSFDRGIDT